MPLPQSQRLAETIERLLRTSLEHALFAGAVCRVLIGGEDAVTVALGAKATLDDDGLAIPLEAREPVHKDTLFDIASVTKVFSAHTLLTLVQRGELQLDEPVGAVLQDYRAGEKRGVTLRHLLTHTAGLPAEWRGWHAPLVAAVRRRPPDAEPFRSWPLSDRDELIASLLGTPLTAAPGTRWEYSDAGLNTAMLLAQEVTCDPWPALVARHTLEPLGLHGATFSPDRAATAATEYQPQYGRGVVRGIVHDEASWSLGGSTANAGMFATADALLRFGEAIRLGEGWVRGDAMCRDQLDGILGPIGTRSGPLFGASIGLRIGETEWMSDRGAASRGHTGFTGTSLQVDRDLEATIVLLTNRVHPTRHGASVHPLRAAIADAVLTAAG